MFYRTSNLFCLWTVCVVISATLCADVTRVRKGGVLFVEDFDPIRQSNDPNKGWSLGNPPQVEMKRMDGPGVSVRNLGPAAVGRFMRYVPFDLGRGKRYAYLKVDLGETHRPMRIANLSKNGEYFTFGFSGPGLFTADLRYNGDLARRRKGVYALTFYVLDAEEGEKRGDFQINRIWNDSSTDNHIEAVLIDRQPPGKPGHGVASIGDVIRLRLTLSKPAEEVLFSFMEGEQGEPIRLGGKTLFEGAIQNGGKTWSAEVSVTEESDTTFSTLVDLPGKPLSKGPALVTVTARIKGGPYPKIGSFVPFSFDLTIE